MRLAEIDPINLYGTHKTFSLELASVLESQERVWGWKVCHPHFWAHPPCPGLIRELGQVTLGLPYAQHHSWLVQSPPPQARPGVLTPGPVLFS